MKPIKLTEQYDQKNRSWARCNFEDNEYGFQGDYINKEGIVNVWVSQDSKCNYHLQMTIFDSGYEYNRGFECSGKPSYRLVAKRAKQFMEDYK